MQPCVRHYFMKQWVSNMCFEKYFVCIFSHENKSSNCGEICSDFFLCCCYLLLRCKHCVRQFTNDTSSCKWMLELYIKDHQDICRKDNRDLDKAYIIVSDTWKQMCLWKPDIFTVIFLHFPACYLFSFEGHICISFQTVSLLFHMFYSSWITLICITTFLI